MRSTHLLITLIAVLCVVSEAAPSRKGRLGADSTATRTPSTASTLACISLGALRFGLQTECYISAADDNGRVAALAKDFDVSVLGGGEVSLPLESTDGGYTWKFTYTSPQDLPAGNAPIGVSAKLSRTGEDVSDSPNYFRVVGVPGPQSIVTCDETTIALSHTTTCIIYPMDAHGSTSAKSDDFHVEAGPGASVSPLVTYDDGQSFSFSYTSPAEGTHGQVVAVLGSTGKHLRGSPVSMRFDNQCVHVRNVSPATISPGGTIDIFGGYFGEPHVFLGSALRFDGANTHVIVDDGEGLPSLQAFSDMAVELWYHTPNANVWDHLEERVALIVFGSEHDGWSLHLQRKPTEDVQRGPIHVVFEMNVSGAKGPTNSSILSASALEPNSWYHIAVAREGRTLHILLNGVVDASSHGAAGILTYGDLPILTMGTRFIHGEPREMLTGDIDELRLWNRALDACTVREWMRQGVTPSHPLFRTLMGYWKFNEGINAVIALESVVEDSVGFLNGTLVGYTQQDTFVFTNIPASDTPIIGIGNEDCQDVELVSPTHLTCTVPASLASSSEPLAISVSLPDYAEDESAVSANATIVIHQAVNAESELHCASKFVLPFELVPCTIRSFDSRGVAVPADPSAFNIASTAAIANISVDPLDATLVRFTVLVPFSGNSLHVEVELRDSDKPVAGSPFIMLIVDEIVLERFPTVVFAGSRVRMEFDLRVPVPGGSDLQVVVEDSLGNQNAVEMGAGDLSSTVLYKVHPEAMSQPHNYTLHFGVAGTAAALYGPPTAVSALVVESVEMSVSGLPTVVQAHSTQVVQLFSGVEVPFDGPLFADLMINRHNLTRIEIKEGFFFGSAVLNTTLMEPFLETLNELNFALSGPSSKYYVAPPPYFFSYEQKVPVSIFGLKTLYYDKEMTTLTAYLSAPVPAGHTLVLSILSDDGAVNTQLYFSGGMEVQGTSLTFTGTVGPHLLTFSLSGTQANVYEITRHIEYTIVQFRTQTAISVETSPTVIFSGSYFPFTINTHKHVVDAGKLVIRATGSDGNSTTLTFDATSASTRATLDYWPQGSGVFNLTFNVEGPAANAYTPPPPVSFVLSDQRSSMFLIGSMTEFAIGQEIPVLVDTGVPVPYGHHNLTLHVICTNGFEASVQFAEGEALKTFTFAAGQTAGYYTVSFRVTGEPAHYYYAPPSYGITVDATHYAKRSSQAQVIAINNGM